MAVQRNDETAKKNILTSLNESGAIIYSMTYEITCIYTDILVIGIQKAQALKKLNFGLGTYIQTYLINTDTEEPILDRKWLLPPPYSASL